MSDLTVVMINKNSGKYIKQTCLSILSQNFDNFKVYLVDSDSTDNSLEKIKLLKNDKIKIFNVDKNVNTCDAYLHGIKNVNTKYITFTTSTDGYIDNEWFSTAVFELESDQKLSFVYANSLQRKRNQKLNSINQEFYLKCKMPSHENFLPFYAATGYHINELNCVWSTKVVKNIIEQPATNLYSFDSQNLNFDFFETLEFLAIKEGFLGKYINTIANYGREHEKSLTEKFNNMQNVSKTRNQISKARKRFILKNLRNFIFKDRDINKISYVNNSTKFNFFFQYFFYLIFFPQFKKIRPIYSLHFLFSKLINLIYQSFWLGFLNKIIEVFKNKKFFNYK